MSAPLSRLSLRQLARRSDWPCRHVADRLARKITPFGGYTITGTGRELPIKVFALGRVLSIYATGTIEQSHTPRDTLPIATYDPHARESHRNRDHATFLARAARYRRHGEYADARRAVLLARSLRDPSVDLDAVMPVQFLQAAE